MGQPAATAASTATGSGGNVSMTSAGLDAMGQAAYGGSQSSSSTDEESGNFDMSVAMAEPGSQAAVGGGGSIVGGANIEADETLWTDIDIDAMVTL